MGPDSGFAVGKVSNWSYIVTLLYITYTHLQCTHSFPNLTLGNQRMKKEKRQINEKENKKKKKKKKKMKKGEGKTHP